MEEAKILGAVSKNTQSKIGTGTTTRKVNSKTYHFAERGAEGNYFVRPLDIDFKPCGEREKISEEDFLRDFQFEPEIHKEKVFPHLKEIDEFIVKGDELRGDRKLYGAKFEYSSALRIDERHIRGTFGLGLVYFEQQEYQNAQEMFDKLKGLESLFGRDNIFMLNEFGIRLRKAGLFDDAITFYYMALDLVQDDENLHYNIAKAFCYKKEYNLAYEHISKALELRPDKDLFKELKNDLDTNLT